MNTYKETEGVPPFARFLALLSSEGYVLAAPVLQGRRFLLGIRTGWCSQREIAGWQK
jgi:hypothetical protein